MNSSPDLRFSDGLTPADRAIIGVETTGSVAEAVLASVSRSGDRRVAVVPEGPYVIPSA